MPRRSSICRRSPSDQGAVPQGLPGLRQLQGVGGGAGQHRHVQVLHQLDLTLRESPGGGNHRCPQALRPPVQSQPSGEEAVSVGHLHRVLPAYPRQMQAPGHVARPGVQIRGGVGHHRGVPRGARGGVEAHQVGPVAPQPPQGVVLLQVLLGGEGKGGQGFQGVQIPPGKPRVPHLPGIGVVPLLQQAEPLPGAFQGGCGLVWGPIRVHEDASFAGMGYKKRAGAP